MALFSVTLNDPYLPKTTQILIFWFAFLIFSS